MSGPMSHQRQLEWGVAAAEAAKRLHVPNQRETVVVRISRVIYDENGSVSRSEETSRWYSDGDKK